MGESATIKCTECSQRFKSVQDMKQHSEAEHGIPFLICQLCGRCFSELDQLTTHMVDFHKRKEKTWTKEEMVASGHVKETRLFPCTQCRKSCPSKAQLQQHIKWHNDKPRAMPKFMCHLCIPRIREFVNQTHLNRHIELVHSDNGRHRQRKNREPVQRKANTIAQGFTVENGLELVSMPEASFDSTNTDLVGGSRTGLDFQSASGEDSVDEDRLNEQVVTSSVERDLVV